jgi:hypothetical protein
VNGGTATFTMPYETARVSASFEAIPYEITITKVGSDTATVNAQNEEGAIITTATYKEQVRIYCTPDTGYGVSSVTVKGEKSGSKTLVFDGGRYQFAMPAAKVTVNVTFAKKAKVEGKVALTLTKGELTGSIDVEIYSNCLSLRLLHLSSYPSYLSLGCNYLMCRRLICRLSFWL